MPFQIPHPSPRGLIGYKQSTSSRPSQSESGPEALSKQSENLIQPRPPHQHGSAVLDTSIDKLNSLPKTGIAQTKKPLSSLPTALPCVDLQDNASESQAAMEDDDALVHDGDEEDHEISMDEDGGAARADAEPHVSKRQSGQPSSTKRKRLTHGALPVGHADSHKITDLRIMKLIRAFHANASQRAWRSMSSAAKPWRHQAEHGTGSGLGFRDLPQHRR